MIDDEDQFRANDGKINLMNGKNMLKASLTQ